MLDRFDWSAWSDWTPFRDIDMTAVPRTPGTYIIASEKPIHRAVGIDTLGVLDVGESDNLNARLKGFRRCATTRGQAGHMAGWRYAFFRFERHFPLASLRVRWLSTESKQAAYAAEGLVLLEYIKTHCELPPLNYKFNWNDTDAMSAYFETAT